MTTTLLRHRLFDLYEASERRGLFQDMIDHGFDMADLPAFLSTVDDMVDELETLQRQYDELESRFETVEEERNSLQDEVYHLHGGE